MKNKAAFFFTVFLIFTLVDPFSFEIPFRIFSGPYIRISDIFFVIFFLRSLRHINIVLKESKIFILILFWIFWGIFEIVRGSFFNPISVSITESKEYVLLPCYIFITFILLKYDFEVEKFFSLFLKPALWSVLFIFIYSYFFFIVTGEYRQMSLAVFISPSFFKNFGWNDENTWVRYLNSYNASFLALITCIFITLKYRFNIKNIINVTTLVLSFIAIALGQVRTVWGIFGFIMLISLFTIFHKKGILKKIKVVFFIILTITLCVLVLVYLNKENIIDLTTTIQPFVQGFGQSGTFQWREIVWLQALQKWYGNPILGLGYGGYYLGPEGENVLTPHSSYIAVLTKQGIIGLVMMTVLFFILIIHFMKNYLKNKKTYAKIGGIIGTLTIVSMLIFGYSYEFTILQWIMVGLALFLTNSKLQEDTFLKDKYAK